MNATALPNTALHNAASQVRTLSGALLDLLFPPVCAGCGRTGHLICPHCAQAVTPVPATICRRCGRIQPAVTDCCPTCQADGNGQLMQVRAAGLHVAPLRELIHLLKYEQRPDLAAPLGRYLVAALALPDWDGLRAQLDAVVPVPLHAARRKERGYNQSELLARALCRGTGLALRSDWLTRPRATRSQVGLNAGERQVNVQDAFEARAACAGRRILLVDDVYTTGATLRACAQALTAAGAASVCALTLALPSHTTSHTQDPQ